jgi:hypothetical protein
VSQVKDCNVCGNAEMGSMGVGKGGCAVIEEMHRWWKKRLGY